MDTRDVNAALAGDVLLAGSPGPLMDWTSGLIAGAIAARQGSVEHWPIDGETRWSPSDPAADTGIRLFLGNFLQDHWVAPIRDGQILAILVLDDIGLVWERLRGQGQSPAEATHNMVAVATAFGDITGAAGVLSVVASDKDDLGALAMRILRHIGLPDAVVDLPETDLRPLSVLVPDELRAAIDTVIRPAFAYGAGGGRVPVIWPRDRLFWGDSPGNPLPRVLDLTGPSRILAYGPYLALPPGQWTMSTMFALSPASRGAMLSLGLYSANELGRIAFTAEGPGLFKATVPVVVESSRQHLEIRLISERGAIEGTIGMGEIVFTPA